METKEVRRLSSFSLLQLYLYLSVLRTHRIKKLGRCNSKIGANPLQRNRLLVSVGGRSLVYVVSEPLDMFLYTGAAGPEFVRDAGLMRGG